MEKITIAQIIAKLNELVSEFKGQKVHSFANLHKEVAEKVNPYLETVGLKYGVWNICPIISSYYVPVLKMQIPNFIDDKRATHTRMGQIVDIDFVLAIKGDESLTLEENLASLENIKNKKLIQQTEEHIEDLRAELEDAEKRLAELKKNSL